VTVAGSGRGLRAYAEQLLFHADMDLSLSAVDHTTRGFFTVRTRASVVRVGLGLLFGLPCLSLLGLAFSGSWFGILLAVVFCPPMLVLAIMFGLVRQSRTFQLGNRVVVKRWSLPGFTRTLEDPLPPAGVVVTAKHWDSGGDSGGCWMYTAEIEGVRGLGFTIANDHARRDHFARDLAAALGYTLREDGELGHRVNPVHAPGL
jgi:hypothetical protein